MPLLGLLLGLAAGTGTRLAETHGHRWVLLVAAIVYFVVAVVGFTQGQGRATAAALVGVVVGYLGTAFVGLFRARRNQAR